MSEDLCGCKTWCGKKWCLDEPKRKILADNRIPWWKKLIKMKEK